MTSSGDEPARATVLFRLTELELRAGNWGTALRYAREADELMRQAGIEQEQYVTTMSLAAVLAHLGELAEASALGRSAFDLATAAGDRVVANRSAGVLGFIELSAGKPEAALEWLLPARHELERIGTAELSISGVLQNAIEALARTGRLDEAEEAIFVCRPQGGAYGSRLERGDRSPWSSDRRRVTRGGTTCCGCNRRSSRRARRATATVRARADRLRAG